MQLEATRVSECEGWHLVNLCCIGTYEVQTCVLCGLLCNIDEVADQHCQPAKPVCSDRLIAGGEHVRRAHLGRAATASSSSALPAAMQQQLHLPATMQHGSKAEVLDGQDGE